MGYFQSVQEKWSAVLGRGSHPALAVSALVAAVFTAPAQCSFIYNNIPGPLPPSVVAMQYQANQTSEFGDLIQFAGTDRSLKTVTLVMDDWARASTYNSMSPTWSHPITLNLYTVNNSGAAPEPGTLIATQTHTFAIPWQPEVDPTCGGGPAWRAGDGNCYIGVAFEITFDFTGTTVPGQIIYGVAFNTNTSGYQPIGQPGPYELLNFGVSSTASPAVGTRPFPDTAYWNTTTANLYFDKGATGVGIFRRDTAWTPYSAAASFEATPSVPEPATFALLGMGLLGVGLVVRRRRAVALNAILESSDPIRDMDKRTVDQG